MTDVSDRRREPKGIPTGGEFAKEDSGAADAADLEEAAFERAEREADEYYSSLTDEDLERQWMEESGVVVLSGFLGVVRRVLAPLGRR